MKMNDPVRAKKAWIRLVAALVAAVVLLAVSGFGVFKMLGTPKSLMVDWSAMMPAEGSAEPEPAAGAQLGDYVEHEVNLILSNFAEGYHGDTVRERYAVVPVNGQLVAFCFPQRWLESEQAIADATQNLLNGIEQYIDKYIVVRGTVKALPEKVSAELYSWFGENQEWMTAAGLIQETDDASHVLADYMVEVDAVGSFNVGAVLALTAAAGLCLLYALYELIRILAKGYAPKEIPETGEENTDDIEVEITESDPETGEDVTDIEVEIIESDPETGEDVTDIEAEIVVETPAQEEPTEDADA